MLRKVLISVMSDLENGTLLLSVKTFTGRPPAIRHLHVKIIIIIIIIIMHMVLHVSVRIFI